MALSEFGIIRRYFTGEGLNFSRPGIDLGPGDDCALLSVPADYQLAITLDVVSEGVHFPRDSLPGLIAWRALAVNLSDLAAMGAEPLCFTLGLSLPRAEPDWLEDLSRGLANCAQQFQCPLVGGDLTRGPLSLAIQAHGLLPCGQALLRSGARVGDLVFVTGTLGDAAAALGVLEHFGCNKGNSEAVASINFAALTAAYRDHFINAFYRPSPRIAAGRTLRGLATAAIDISDGLLADLGHITAASGVAGRVNLHELPLSAAMQACIAENVALRLAATGGDDYELCFTAAPGDRAAVEERLGRLDLPVRCIGEIVEGSGVSCFNEGAEVTLDQQGFSHFREDGEA